MPNFSAASQAQLATCDDRLQRLFREVVKHYDCIVLQGARSEAEERRHMADGTSKLTDPRSSKHVTYAGRPVALAADVAPYPLNWKDLDRFRVFGGFVKGVASQMGIPIRWGGDWDGDWDFHDQTFNDFPHFELGS